jgi:hypothetical protein
VRVLDSIKLLIDNTISKEILNKILKSVPKSVFFTLSDNILEIAREETWNFVITRIKFEDFRNLLEVFPFVRAFIFFLDSNTQPNVFWKEVNSFNGTSDIFIDVNPEILELSLKNAIRFVEKYNLLEDLISENNFFNLFTNLQGPVIRKFLLDLKNLFNVYDDIALISEKGCRREDFCNYISNGKFLLFDLEKIPETSVYSKLFANAEKVFFQIGDGVIFLENFDNSSHEFQKKVYKLMLKRYHKKGDKKINFFGKILLGVNEETWENAILGDIKNFLGNAVLRIPPLRERAEDIPYMLDHMISVYSNKLKKTVAYPSNDIIDFLKDYNWPGNFEEFQQLVNDFIISGDEKKLLDYAMKRLIVTPNNVEKDFPRLPDTTKKLVSKIEKDLIIRALEVSSKNKKKASKLLGISYKTLVQKMKKYGIK